MNTFQIKNLRTEYIVNPIGLDEKIPRFSWMMTADHQGALQTAYQIQITDTSVDTIIWDSTKVESRLSSAIAYAGEALTPCTRYQWQVTVWNEADQAVAASAYFETGLMNADISAWEGAEFIGQKDLSLEASTLGIFSLDLRLCIPEGSSRAGVVFGANDDRLLSKAKNTYAIEGENYLCYMLDISAIPAMIHIYRVGYHPEDTRDIPFASFSVRDFDAPDDLIITEANKHQEHALTLECQGNQIMTLVDGHMVDKIQDESPYLKATGIDKFVGRQVNPVSFNDCPTFPRLCQVGLVVDQGEAHFKSLEIRNIRTPGALLQSITPENAFAIFNASSAQLHLTEDAMVLSSTKDWMMILGDPSHGAAPMLRSEFTVNPEKTLLSARVYATARGIYEGHVNGTRFTQSLFNPGASQFDKHLYYQTYDITDRITTGTNAIGFYLASGWWSDAQTFSLMNYNYFGDRPALLAKVVLEYTDGTRDLLITDTSHWTISTEGPVRYAGFFYGEYYDARLNEAYQNFSCSGYANGQWETPIVVELVRFKPEPGGPFRWPAPTAVMPKLIGYPADQVNYGEVKNALSMTEPVPGVYIYDMGQNMAAVPRLQLHGKPGQRIMIRYGEVLYPELEEYQDLEGLMLTENLRDALNTDIYICKGDGRETYLPRFTFHGYRYIEISGIEAPLPLSAVESVAVTSIKELTGHIETSNSLLNKLFENITYSQRSNFISIPTDCPQRNERMGWMGDTQVFARTAAYNADVLTFFRRYLTAVRDLQSDAGKYPDIAPVGGGFGGIVWESAGIIIPWEMYQQYGDVRIVEENYEAMKKYIAYIKDLYDHQKYKHMMFLGDWLATDMSTDQNLIWLCHYAYDVKLVEKMARILGRNGDAENYQTTFESLKAIFNQTFFNTEIGRTVTEAGVENDTQCSYALPLAFELFTEGNKLKAARRLDEKTRELDYALTTGFIGTGLINPVLTDAGYADTAYRLVQQTQYPSWLYSITQGATSIWERWNSVTKEAGFGGNNSMNSFNHYSLGAIGAWMYSHVLGIKRREDTPGFAKFVIRPYITGLDYAKGSYDCIYGSIKSQWIRVDNHIHFEVDIPANTEAMLYLPGMAPTTLRSGHYVYDIR